MHPRECFWFGPQKYQSLIKSRQNDQLQSDQDRKQAKIVWNRKRMTWELVLAVMTHGALIWLVFFSMRSTSVAKLKLGIIREELRQRLVAKHTDRLQELERINGKPFDQTEIDALLRILDANEVEQVTRRTATEGQDNTYWPDHNSSGIDDDLPPPYERTNSKRH